MIQSTTSIIQSTAWPYCLMIAALLPLTCRHVFPVGQNLSTWSIQSTGSTSSWLVVLLHAAAACPLFPACVLHPGRCLAACVAACGRMRGHMLAARHCMECMAWLGWRNFSARVNVFHPFSTFDQFSSILYDFCMISTIPKNSTQKHKYGENTQLYTN